jgi:hypothetical protein
MFSDAFLLDTESWEWRRCEEAEALGRLVGHTAVLGRRNDGSAQVCVCVCVYVCLYVCMYV